MAALKIALLSDVHGNLPALEAVLADITAWGNVDAYWLLGDYAAMGPEPVKVLERINRLPNARFIRGNTDRYIATGDRPAFPSTGTIEATQLPGLLEAAQSFSWTQGAMWATGWREWLAALPLDFRETLPDGTRVLCVHASPGTDDGLGMRPTMSEAELAPLFAESQTDLVFVGHTHWPQDRVLAEQAVSGVRVVNVGSVGLSFTPDGLACYMRLSADEGGYRVEHRQLDYDRDTTVAALTQQRHPATDFITGFVRGTRRPPWAAQVSQ
ncbi:MAG: metallophosphoesterase family protein [Anaerolineales bacterium]